MRNKKKVEITEEGVKNIYYDNKLLYVIPPLPDKLKEEAVQILLNHLSGPMLQNLSSISKKDITKNHFGLGMSIRNLLRINGIPDSRLPKCSYDGGATFDTQNWDDYYVDVLEQAVEKYKTGVSK